MEHKINKQMPTRAELLSDCPMRHPENGNCGPAGGFCQPGTEICKAIQSAYNAGRNDAVLHIAPTGLDKLLERLECPDNVSSCEHLKRFGHSCVQCTNNAATEAAAAIKALLAACDGKANVSAEQNFQSKRYEPLTLEELLELEGLPVWVVPVSEDADWDPCWVIFNAEFMSVPSKSSKTMVYALYANKNYKWKWLAYRNKTSNRTLEHDLKPVVSQDDLLEMADCPIWVVPLGENPEWNPCWTICGNSYSFVYPKNTKNNVWLLCKNKDYGKTWLAYPKKEV